MKKLLVLAVVLRLLVSAFYFHPDIKTYHYQASFLRKGVVNIYKHLIHNKNDLLIKEEFVYFPLTYVTLGAYQAIISPFFGSDFDAWLGDAGSSTYINSPHIFKYLVALKLPYLTLDILIAFLIKKFFDDKKAGEKAMLIWLFNPFSIILLYVFSNIDIIPTTLTVLSFLAMKKGNLKRGSLLLGLAAGFKLYPLLFVPFLFLNAKTQSDKVRVVVIPILTFAAICLPFASSEFVNSAVLSGLSTRIFNPGIPIGFNETIIVSLFAIAALFFYAYLEDKQLDLFKYWLAMYLLIFSFAHFHIQWLVWLAPFLVVLIVKRPSFKWVLAFIAGLALTIPMLYADRSMNISLFRVYATLYDILPTPFSVIEPIFDPYNLQSILHTVMAGASLGVIYKLFKKKASV